MERNPFELVADVLGLAAALAGMLTALVHLRRAKLEGARAGGPAAGLAPHGAVVTRDDAGARVRVPPLEAALIGVRVGFYWTRFRALRARDSERGRARFVPSWNWGAFFLGGFWFLYRKVYAVGAVFLVLDLAAAVLARVRAGEAAIAAAGIVLLSIAAATVANYVYFRSVTRRADEIRATTGDETEALALARRVGGVSTRTLVAAAVVFGIVLATSVVVSDDALYNQSRRFVRRGLRAAGRWL